jgi:hypothetical protein
MNDLTQFIKSSSNNNFVRVISDPEGEDIVALAGISTYENQRLILCGDILDSTFVGQINDQHISRLSYNIRNIKLIVDNSENIKLIVGNRDINKVKVLPLTTLEGDSELIKKFNNGEIDLSYTTFNKLFNENPQFKVKNMNNWYPYWKFINSQSNENSKNWNYDTKDSFLNRYYNIFGVDNNKDNENTGTMSAQNTIECIYTELHEMQILPTTDKILQKSLLDEYKAFLTLAVYRSMLIPDEPINNTTVGQFRGYLYKMLKNAFITAYAINKNKILMFSHGGIIPSTDLQKYYNAVKECHTKGIYNYQTTIKQSGGFYKNTDASDIICKDETLKVFFHEAHTIYKNSIDLLEKEIYNDDEPSVNMLFLLAISAPFNNIKLCKSNNNPVTEIMSPIQANINLVRKEFFFVANTERIFETIQIIGHRPSGFASTIDYIEHNQKTPGWIINLDTTMTYSHSIINGLPAKTGYSYLLIRSNFTLVSRGIININNNHLKKTTKINKDSSGYISSKNSVRIDQDIVSHDLGIKIKTINTDKYEIHVHKLGDNNTDSVVMIKGNSFNKTLIISTYKDLKKLLL